MNTDLMVYNCSATQHLTVSAGQSSGHSSGSYEAENRGQAVFFFRTPFPSSCGHSQNLVPYHGTIEVPVFLLAVARPNLESQRAV